VIEAGVFAAMPRKVNRGARTTAGANNDPARSAADHAPDRPLEARPALGPATKAHRLGLVEVDDVPA
jgi:hypothetical protein